MYLYIKTHATGLKYLGKTNQDPFKYKGSGTHWLRHLNKHGEEHTTEILFETDNKELFKKTALYYSDLYNVVESKEWANIVPEQGDGGDTTMSPAYQAHIASGNFLYGKKNGFYGKQHTDETKRKISEKNKGKKLGPQSMTEELRKKYCKANAGKNKGKDPWNKGKVGVQPKSLETKKKISIPVIFRGVEYYSIKEAARQNGLSDFLVKKECSYIK